MTLGGEPEEDRRSHTQRDLRPACGEMVWPLDEGAACPLYVRTVDQAAACRRRSRVSWCSFVQRPSSPSCVCGEPITISAKG
jgi:hypothetical protein